MVWWQDCRALLLRVRMCHRLSDRSVWISFNKPPQESPQRWHEICVFITQLSGCVEILSKYCLYKTIGRAANRTCWSGQLMFPRGRPQRRPNGSLRPSHLTFHSGGRPVLRIRNCGAMLMPQPQWERLWITALMNWTSAVNQHEFSRSVFSSSCPANISSPLGNFHNTHFQTNKANIYYSDPGSAVQPVMREMRELHLVFAELKIFLCF